MSAPPGNENGRPGKGGPESSTATKNETILPPRGCPCGCVAGEPCVTERPVNADADPWCCASYGVDSLARGYGCPAHTRSA